MCLIKISRLDLALSGWKYLKGNRKKSDAFLNEIAFRSPQMIHSTAYLLSIQKPG